MRHWKEVLSQCTYIVTHYGWFCKCVFTSPFLPLPFYRENSTRDISWEHHNTSVYAVLHTFPSHVSIASSPIWERAGKDVLLTHHPYMPLDTWKHPNTAGTLVLYTFSCLPVYLPYTPVPLCPCVKLARDTPSCTPFYMPLFPVNTCFSLFHPYRETTPQCPGKHLPWDVRDTLCMNTTSPHAHTFLDTPACPSWWHEMVCKHPYFLVLQVSSRCFQPH